MAKFRVSLGSGKVKEVEADGVTENDTHIGFYDEYTNEWGEKRKGFKYIQPKGYADYEKL